MSSLYSLFSTLIIWYSSASSTIFAAYVDEKLLGLDGHRLNPVALRREISISAQNKLDITYLRVQLEELLKLVRTAWIRQELGRREATAQSLLIA